VKVIQDPAVESLVEQLRRNLETLGTLVSRRQAIADELYRVLEQSGSKLCHASNALATARRSALGTSALDTSTQV